MMIKSITLTVWSVMMLFSLVNLGNALAAPLPQAEPGLYPYSADGLTYGYVDETGEWVIEPKFDFAADFVEDLAVMEQGGEYGYIDTGGNVVVEPQYDFAADFAFGLAPVVVDGEFGYIDQTGQPVIEPQFNDAYAFTAEGLAAVRPDQSYGYIDRTGQFVIEPQFESAASFSEDLAAVTADGNYGFIDSTGQFVIEPQFDFASTFSEGLAAVLVDGRVGFIDQSGEIVIEPAYDYAQDFSEGLAAVSVDGLTGYIDPAGQIVIEPQFDFAESFSEGLAAAREEALIGFIDPTGRMVIAPQFDDAGAFRNGLARVERAHQWGYIDPSGQPRFLLSVSAISPAATLILPFLPGVPAPTRDGICLSRSISVPEPFAWRCIVEADEPNESATFDPCLTADNGRTLVCGADPLVGDPGFRVNLVEPLPKEDEKSPIAQTGGDNRVWLVQLADGSICRFALGVTSTIDGERANYTCSDGSVLLGDLQPGTVWQADRIALADILRTEDGYEAGQISPVEIAVIWQPVDPAAVLEEIGLTADELGIDYAGVAETITPQLRPAVPFEPALSARLDGEPAHLRFVFDNEDLPEFAGIYRDQAQLLIYPVEAYQAMAREAGTDEVSQRIEALQTLLQDRPETIEGEIPVLPAFGDADQQLATRIKYLDFDGGAGIRFVTHYGVEAAPITDHSTFYTFQGLTDDGKYYIAYYHPAATKLLPADVEEIARLVPDHDTFAENFKTYLQETNDRLAGANTTDFTPNLVDLDTMIESLQIQP
ncbi:MAG: WG repeat-containing protein [Anaerolineae bacterium]|nr:WG repeat-containing protein [Anaerolineae bacterium]